MNPKSNETNIPSSQSHSSADIDKQISATKAPDVQKSLEEQLSFDLIQAQTQLRERRNETNARGLLILVNGMENAGKGEAVKALTEWMDARYIKVHATMGQHPSHFQPIWQRHTMQLPRHGEVAIYFGNWYADLIRYVFDCGDDVDEKRLNQMIDDIQAFEQDLINNHTDILKCWFSVDNKTLKKRLKDDEPDLEQLYHLDWSSKKHLKRFKNFGEKLHSLQTAWHHLDGENFEASNIQFAQITLHAIQNILELQTNAAATTQDTKATSVKQEPMTDSFKLAVIPKQLQHPDNKTLDKAKYKKLLKRKQKILADLIRQRGQRHLIFVFEGMDAAGKGGAIRRVIQPLDPREYTIHAISAPTEDELKHPYLWRFWTRLPHDELSDVDIEFFSKKFKRNKCLALLKQRIHDSRVTLFDRSWYGRVLVERIEGFANSAEWQRAFGEINRFEQDLIQSNAIVVKFWLAVSEEEELIRFKARENTPNKQYKITDEDWRNRAKWDKYIQAAADMIAHTHHKDRPWHIIATDDKNTARIKVLDALIESISEQL